jgi:hypothetical protein
MSIASLSHYVDLKRRFFDEFAPFVIDLEKVDKGIHFPKDAFEV